MYQNQLMPGERGTNGLMISVIAYNLESHGEGSVRHLYMNCPEITKTLSVYARWIAQERLDFDEIRVEFVDREICENCKRSFISRTAD